MVLPLGLVTLLLGAAGGYVYFMYLIHSGGLFVLILLASIASVCAGFYFLNKGIASVTGLEKLAPVEDDLVSVPKDGPALENILSRNKTMVEDWTKTNKTRDELKLLEVQAAAQSEKK